MNKSHVQNVIDNEFKRVKIQKHPNYSVWYASLRSYGQVVVDCILSEDVSPELILLAQEASFDEREDYPFLDVVAGGNPAPSNMLGLTNVTLEYILYDLSEV